MTDIGRITSTKPMRPVKKKTNHGQYEQTKHEQHKPAVSEEGSHANDKNKHIDEHV